jgi:hypothetical protein
VNFPEIGIEKEEGMVVVDEEESIAIVAHALMEFWLYTMWDWFGEECLPPFRWPHVACLYSAYRIGDYNGTETLVGWDKYINRFELSEEFVTRARKLFHLTPKPKEESYIYQCPCPKWLERVSLPPRYRVSNFMKFSSSENVSTIEHNNRFLAQCGAASIELLLVGLFQMSLSRSAFTWFASLPSNSINMWVDPEKKLHMYLFTRVSEMTLTNLIVVREWTTELVSNSIQQFRDVSRCFSLNLSDQELVELWY